MSRILRFDALAAALLFGTGIVFGTAAYAVPLPYSGGSYTQNFDALPTDVTNPTQLSLPKSAFYLNPAVTNLSDLTGWQGNNVAGSSATTDFHSQDGSLSGNAGRGIQSYGTNVSTERALGTLATSNNINAFGLVIQNTSGTTITEFTLSYTGEQWRRGDNTTTPETLTFAYAVDTNIDGALINVAAFSLSSPNMQLSPLNVALNGNLALNQTAKSGTVTGLNWANNQLLILRWTSSEISGQDDGLAIDNLTFSAPVPEPSTLAMAGMGLTTAAIVALRRRGRHA